MNDYINSPYAQPYQYMNGYRNYMTPTMPMNGVNPQVPQNVNPQVQQSPMPSSNIPWIQVPSLNSAKDIMVTPNQTAYIMNQNKQEFYVKSADTMGVANLKCFRFEEFSPDEEEKQIEKLRSGDFITRDEFNNLAVNSANEIQNLKAVISALNEQIANNNSDTKENTATVKKDKK